MDWSLARLGGGYGRIDGAVYATYLESFTGSESAAPLLGAAAPLTRRAPTRCIAAPRCGGTQARVGIAGFHEGR
ncbi:hypothetical protein WME75_18505 [Sorangium sp. So ce1014]|uniref:hypothetical protein n=1 Tax=Sorangium sp. So ce1014 TaxID=3133326 RepID=UPI003F6308C7